ncbi:MAG TPA: zf-HC2 domain-containing protein [Candidatus Dormibacteraeota bacterium]|jgi:anti-sigma factor RsiW
MNCRQVVELMTDYLEGALAPADRRRFEAHLSGCDGCTEYLRQLRTSMALARRLGEEPIPASLEAELLEAFRHWKTG